MVTDGGLDTREAYWTGERRMTMDLLAGERRKAKVSQEQLAEALGITRTRLAMLETSPMVIPMAHFAEKWMGVLRSSVQQIAADD